MCITMCSFSLFPENVWQKCLQIHLKSLYPILMVIGRGDSFGRFWKGGSGKSLWESEPAGNCSSWLLVQVPRPMSGYLKTAKDFWNRQGNFWNLSFHAHENWGALVAYLGFLATEGGHSSKTAESEDRSFQDAFFWAETICYETQSQQVKRCVCV